jgi:hypothetical protein
MLMPNTVAYYDMVTITSVKRFIVQALGEFLEEKASPAKTHYKIERVNEA